MRPERPTASREQEAAPLRKRKNNPRRRAVVQTGFSPPAGPSLKAATDMYQELKAGALQGLRLGLLHGRMDADEKEIIMRRFQRRKWMC